MRTIIAVFVMIVLIQTVVTVSVEQSVTAEVVKQHVAYIYRSDGRIDYTVIAMIDNAGFNVSIVHETDFVQDSSDYAFIVLGDDRYRESISVNNFSAIVLNNKNGAEFGLTNRNGVSQLGSTRPLTVQYNQSIVQVYTQAFYRGRLALSYYFLDKNSVAESAVQIAATKATSSGSNFGDVISYFEAGSEMANGNIQQGNLCFFGIIESEFWTQASRDLFRDCIDFVSH